MSKFRGMKVVEDGCLFAPMREADIIRRPVVAYCDSDECLLFSKKKVARIEVKATPDGHDCSWCGHAVFWQAEGKDPFEMTEEEYEEAPVEEVETIIELENDHV